MLNNQVSTALNVPEWTYVEKLVHCDCDFAHCDSLLRHQILYLQPL